MNVLLINDSSSNPNWGDRAAAIALQEILVARGAALCGSVSEDSLSRLQYFKDSFRSDTKRNISSAEKILRLAMPPLFTLIGESVARLWCRASGEMPIPTTWDCYGEAAKRWMRETENWIELKQGLEAADMVLVHGDGAIATRSNIAFSILFLVYLAKLVIGKPVGIVNHTVDTTDADLIEIVRNLYPFLDLITFRETRSVTRCRDFCNGRYVPDTGFWFSPAPKDLWTQLVRRKTYLNIWPHQFDFDPTAPYICIGGSSLFYPVTDEQIGILQSGYAALVEKIREFWEGQIVFVASDIRDENILKSLASHYKTPFLPVVTPVQQAVDLLGHAAAYVGGRWHAGIFALRGGAPVVPLASKTFKISALCEMAEINDDAVNAYDLEICASDVAARLRDVLGQGEALRTRLSTWASEQALAITENEPLFRKC